MEWASPRQQRGVGKVRLGAPHLFPQGLSTISPHCLSSIPRLPLGFWAHRHVTLPGPGHRDVDQGRSNKAVEEGQPGPGWGTDALRNQTLRIFAYLGHSPSQNILENCNKMTLTGVCVTVYLPLWLGSLVSLLSRLVKLT